MVNGTAGSGITPGDWARLIGEAGVKGAQDEARRRARGVTMIVEPERPGVRELGLLDVKVP